jgi:hypothetical protein
LNLNRILGLHNGLIDLALTFSLNSVIGFQATELIGFQNQGEIYFISALAIYTPCGHDPWIIQISHDAQCSGDAIALDNRGTGDKRLIDG